MIQYSFNADLRLVCQRLAIANKANTAPAGQPQSLPPQARVIPFRPGTQQPRLEIAQVALRRNRWHDAVP